MQQFYRTAAVWADLNPILLEGELGVVSDHNPPLVKYGDGVTRWTDLPYSGSQPVVELQHTETDLVAGASADFELPAGLAYQLLSVASTQPAWVRVYSSAAARTADTRTVPGNPYPAPGSGFEAEVLTTSAPETVVMSPSPLCQGDGGEAFLRVVNTAVGTATIEITTTTLRLA